MSVQRADVLFLNALASDATMATDPLTSKGSEIMSSMQKEYGPEKGEKIFYASRNKGTISGVDALTDYLKSKGMSEDDCKYAADCVYSRAN